LLILVYPITEHNMVHSTCNLLRPTLKTSWVYHRNQQPTCTLHLHHQLLRCFVWITREDISATEHEWNSFYKAPFWSITIHFV